MGEGADIIRKRRWWNIDEGGASEGEEGEERLEEGSDDREETCEKAATR